MVDSASVSSFYFDCAKEKPENVVAKSETSYMCSVNFEICEIIMRKYGGIRMESGRKNNYNPLEYNSFYFTYCPFHILVRVEELIYKSLKQVNLVAKVPWVNGSNNVKLIIEKILKRDSFISEYVMPNINDQLKNMKCETVKYPSLVYKNYFDLAGKDKLLIFEQFSKFSLAYVNLRPLNYMVTSAVIKTYSSLHAGYQLLEEKREKNEKINRICSELLTEDIDKSSEQYQFLKKSIEALIQSSIELLCDNKKYHAICRWLVKIKYTAVDTFLKMLQPTEKFRTLSHYNLGRNGVSLRSLWDVNTDIEVCLAEFGGSMISSQAIDINIILFTYLDPELRITSIDKLLAIYYNNYEDIVKKGKSIVPFKFIELLKEVRNKMIVGWFAGINTLMTALQCDKRCQDSNLFCDIRLRNSIKKQSAKLKRQYKTNTIFRNRFNKFYADLEHFQLMTK